MSGESGKKTLAIVGLGLIGASIAEATRKRYPDWRIIGVSSPNTIKEALSLKIIDEGFAYDKIRDALEQCDIGFLCTPIDEILKILKGFVDSPLELRHGAIISDVGSTKKEICELGTKAFGNAFIGSHPMAGSEKTGIKARDAHLFENAAWIICRVSKTPEEFLIRFRDFVTGLGSQVILMMEIEGPAPSYELHDLLVARASHFPQILSTSYAAFIADEPALLTDTLNVIGGGFKDMTRLAASSFSVWGPILRTNKKNLLTILPRFRKKLETLEQALDSDGGEKFFTDANQMRSHVSASRKGFSFPTTEILVDLEDKPGALLIALKPLSDADVNILDLEILKVREGEEGVLMMGFRKPEEAQTALELLEKLGHKARLR